MKAGLILATAAALLLAGCSDVNCNGGATNGAEAGACGLHTTFFAARTASAPSAAFRKS